uniref:Secreted protein n=1 Tax=Steinernema glaseri TaxID=37863 RepID=A0A1I7ZBU6_9BILA
MNAYHRSCSAALVISYVSLLSVAPHVATQYAGYRSPASKLCYSCMSKDFERHWPYIDQIYYPPLNFTNDCYDMPPKSNVRAHSCSHAMCVTVIEPRMLAGGFTSRRAHLWPRFCRGPMAHGHLIIYDICTDSSFPV